MLQRILLSLSVLIILASVSLLKYVKLPSFTLQPTAQEPQETADVTGTTTTQSLSISATTSIPAKTTSTSATKAKPLKKLATEPKPIATASPVTEVLTFPIKPPTDFETINTNAQKAIVNILCTTGGNSLSPISGTGIIVNPGGVILTNAHVAEYFLLRNFYQKDFVQCIIRTGSPAQPRYHAELVYISPTWVQNNKDVAKQSNPTGTGENDFAFLRITDSINGSLPPEFNYVLLNTRENTDKGETVVLISYPAGFLGGIAIQQNLNVASAITTIQDFFTFNENTIDLLSLGGTVVSQKGASGGAVVDESSSVIGLISISSSGATTGDRKLYAITPSHISRTLQSEIGMNLNKFLSQDMAIFAKKFQSITAPILTKIITDELTKNQ